MFQRGFLRNCQKDYRIKTLPLTAKSTYIPVQTKGNATSRTMLKQTVLASMQLLAKRTRKMGQSIISKEFGPIQNFQVHRKEGTISKSGLFGEPGFKVKKNMGWKKDL